MQMRLKGLPVPGNWAKKHPKLSMLLTGLGAPIVLVLQAMLLMWGWNAVIADATTATNINLWQAILFMLVHKLCLRKLGRQPAPRPRPAKGFQDPPKAVAIEEHKPSVQ